MAGHNSSSKAILYAFSANLGIAITKGIVAAYTGSGSMIAESIHSVADCINQLLLFIGLRRTSKPPTSEHPLGYGKVIYFWSFIVAVLLFSMGGLFSIYEGIHKLTHPEPLTSAWLALVVLGIAVILESLSLLGCLREIRKIRKDKPFSKWLKTTRNAELVVVLGEDIAALAGLMMAFCFVLMSMLTGDTVYDSIGSICIGATLIIISIFLIIRVQSLLIGKSATPDLQNHIRELMKSEDALQEVFNIITIQYGPQVMLAAKIKLKTGIELETTCQVINRLEHNLKENFPEIEWCFIEPDVCD